MVAWLINMALATF